MNINGKNGLACITKLSDLKEPVELRPTAGLPVIRDLIVDMTQFFKQYHSIKPYLINEDPPPRRSGCSPPRSARSSTASTNASCVRAARPPARRSGGILTSSSGPPDCCKPIGSSPTAATRRRLRGWTTWRTLPPCSAVTPS